MSESKELEIQESVEESSLGKELSQIFTDLCIQGECCIDINSWLRLNLLIKTQEDSIIECLPFHSLLFKDNPKRLEPLIYDKSPASILNILIKKCKYPVISFKDISEEEGIPYEVVRDGALHFARWDKATIIPYINPQSYFVNNDNFNYSSMLVKEWEKIL